MRYKAILFDADGVTIKESRRFSEVLAEQYDIPLEKISLFFENEFKDCLVGRADVKEALAKYVESWGWKGTVDDLMAFWFTVGNEIDGPVAQAIKRLRAEGVSCYLVTNQETYRGQHLCRMFDGLFDGAFVSGDIGCKKDETAFFEHVFNHVGRGLEKHEMLLIDDDIKNVEAARKFGISTIHYQRPDDLNKINI